MIRANLIARMIEKKKAALKSFRESILLFILLHRKHKQSRRTISRVAVRRCPSRLYLAVDKRFIYSVFQKIVQIDLSLVPRWAPTRIFMIRAKCDLRTCFDKIQERIRVNSGIRQRWTANTQCGGKRKKKITKREFNSDNSDTSVCKTNYIGNQ